MTYKTVIPAIIFMVLATVASQDRGLRADLHDLQFYNLLRIYLSGYLLYSVYEVLSLNSWRGSKVRTKLFVVISCVLAFIYNPQIPLRLEVDTWVVVNVVTIVWLLVCSLSIKILEVLIGGSWVVGLVVAYTKGIEVTAILTLSIGAIMWYFTIKAAHKAGSPED